MPSIFLHTFMPLCSASRSSVCTSGRPACKKVPRVADAIGRSHTATRRRNLKDCCVVSSVVGVPGAAVDPFYAVMLKAGTTEFVLLCGERFSDGWRTNSGRPPARVGYCPYPACVNRAISSYRSKLTRDLEIGSESAIAARPYNG